jgi:hypothetical protein
LGTYVLETADEFFETRRRLCFKREILADGVLEGQGSGMQRQTPVRRIRPAIPLIAHHRVSPIRQMDTDLVLSARQ